MTHKQYESLPRGLYIVSVVAFLYQLSIFMTQPILPLFIISMGATLFEVGLILALKSFLIIVLRIPLTLAAKKLGEKRMLLLAFIVQATTSILYSLATSPKWLYFITFYQILALGSFNQITMSMVSNMVPQNRQGDALGRFMTLFSLGMFAGPLMASFFVTQMSYRHLFIVSAIFPTIGFLLLLRYLTQKTETLPPSTRLSTLKLSDLSSSFKSLRREKNVTILAVIRVLYSISHTIFNTLFAIYASQQLKFSPSVITLLFSAIGFTNTFIRIPAGKIADKLTARTILLVTFGAIILNYSAIAYFDNFYIILFLMVVFGTCWGIRAITEWSLLARTVTPKIKTIAFSYLSTFWSIGSTLGSFFAGSSAEIIPFSTLFLIAAVINIPAIPLIYMMKRE